MAQEHQAYIEQKVNPILENLVTQLLLERPEHLSQFMIKWLAEHAKTPAAAALTEGVNELSELKLELEKLQEDVRVLEEEVGDAAFAAAPSGDAADDEDEEEEEEESEDEEDEVQEVDELPSYGGRGPRKSVSAEVYGEWNKKDAFTPPVHPKSEQQKGRLQDVLAQSFLFSCLEAAELAVVIDAMQEKSVEAGCRLIEQGADGDCLFVVEQGQMNCFRISTTQAESRSAENAGSSCEEVLVKECKVGDTFGELALLYNSPRAARACRV
eukprot:TRINITY_DN16790_c0_g2_i4.p2 TRINITY_DN16790_c0_g2~~TRINITY_DN16790_c0_g2_i4.p2  ORF type:complete len:269 (+),score=108.94 TRINITY_DN16790_c0_g2_i4:82-888(+)